MLDPSAGQIVYLSVLEGWTLCALTNTSGTVPVMSCHAVRSFSTSVDRWWYIVAAKCGSIEVCTAAVLAPCALGLCAVVHF